MPFDETLRSVYGVDARRVRSWASGRFCAWLAATLNDPDGPYAAALELTDSRQVIVTDDAVQASVLFVGDVAPPIVYVQAGPADTAQTGRMVDGVFNPGTRWDLTFKLDMGVNDRSALTGDDLNDPEKVAAAVASSANHDRNLADFVQDAVTRGLVALDVLGLNSAELEPDTANQMAGQGRYPHTLTMFVVSLDDYDPDA